MMPCPNCKRLEAELSEMRRLAAVVGNADVYALRRALDLRPTEACMLLRLYRAGGLAVAADALMDEVPHSEDPRIVKVYIAMIRRKVGGAMIFNRFGQGYGLTREGLALVAAALPATEQAA